MKINMSSKGIQITDDFRTLVEKGIGKIEKRFKGQPNCEVTIRPVEKDKVKVSIFVYAGKYIFKGEGISIDKNTAFNSSLKMLEKSLDKTKTKQMMKRYMPEEAKDMLVAEDEGEDEIVDILENITSIKNIKINPMTVEEAYMQMYLLGHTFFAFINKETGIASILYRKRPNCDDYGLIQLTRELA